MAFWCSTSCALVGSPSLGGCSSCSSIRYQFQPPTKRHSPPGMVHQYVDIADALNPAVDCKRTINLFGVVIDCRAPCTTNGADLRSEIAIADESCVLPEANLKKLFVHSFTSDPTRAIPFRQLGDVVRIHKAALIDYAPYGAPTVRQGRIKFYSTIMMWKHDAIDFEPISGPPLVQNDELEYVRPPAHVDLTDRHRIKALRKWAHDFFFTHYKSQRPYLRTVSEILNAPNGTTFLSKTFDMVCYINQNPVSDAEDNLVMTASADATSLSTSIRISSQPPWQTRRVLPKFTFLDFCPSWNVRPPNASWLLLRDVRVVDHGRGREIQLGVSGRTSTLIWNAHNAPDVRVARERCGTPQPNAHTHVAVTRNVVTEPAPLPPTPKRHRASATAEELYRPYKMPMHGRASAATSSENNVLQNRSVLPNHLGAGPSIPADAVSKSTPRAEDHHEIRPVPPAVSDPAPNSNHHLAKLPAPHVIPSSTRREGAHLGIELASHERIVTAHTRTNRKVWRISDMVHAFRRGSGKKMFRLAVWVRGIVWPTDLRHACRLVCAKCERGVQMFRNICDHCGSRGNLWQFMFRLKLEERSASASIESWVVGKEAERLLGLQASDLRMNPRKCVTLKNKLRTLHAAISVVDCLVVPFEYKDDVGFYRVACVMKGTRMLP